MMWCNSCGKATAFAFPSNFYNFWCNSTPFCSCYKVFAYCLNISATKCSKSTFQMSLEL